jgi:hypothetical protein
MRRIVIMDKVLSYSSNLLDGVFNSYSQQSNSQHPE